MSIFPKSENKILKLVYQNPGIRLNELIRQARVSVGTAKMRLDHLLNSNILWEERIMGGKKTLIRNFYPQLESDEGENVFSLLESEKKSEFFKKNKNLTGPFRQLLKNTDKKIRIILVFGSFAAYSQTKDSDLDVLFLTKGETDTAGLKKEIERGFVTFDHEISPRVDTLESFEKNINKEIYRTIIRNHIIIRGCLDYIRLLAKTHRWGLGMHQ